MNQHLIDIFVVLAVLGPWLWLRLKYRRRNPKGLPLPPGPKRLPIIGNVFDMRQTSLWLTVAAWEKTYGDVIYVETFGTPTVFLNSYKSVSDLLERRSSIYSDRPPFPMLNDIMGWDWLLTFIPYGERFRKHRAFLHGFLHSHAVERYQEHQTRETHRLIGYLLETPHDYERHLRRAAGAIILMFAYGHQVLPEDDPFVTLAEKALHSISIAGQPGTFLVDVLPWLKYVPEWFPGSEFKKKGKEWYKLAQAMVYAPFEVTKKKILEGNANLKPSMMSLLMERNTDEDGCCHDEDIIAGCAATSYTGGTDTTVSTLLSFMLALVMNPEVQKRGQEEIDRVVGKDRLPTFADRRSLPYIEGIVQESLRWNPVLPLCPSHRLMIDDEYNGYFIPAGTSVIANQWAILHDEDEYPDPHTFSPERWLPKGTKEGGTRRSNTGCFGFGRRVCPGQYFAENAIFIGVSTIMATLNIDRALDADGKPIVPKGEYFSGFMCYPKLFPCSITARSANAVNLIHQANEYID